MYQWEPLEDQARFADLLRAFERYARPFRPTWPYFWLKAAAVKFDGVWHLCVFSLSGQWSDIRHGQPVEPPLENLVAVSRRLDALSAWQMLESMAANGTIELAEDIVARVPAVSVPPTIAWQSTYPISDIAKDVAEIAMWWYFYVETQVQWLTDPEQQRQAYQAIKPNLDYLNEESFESYISARFARQRPPRANTSSLDHFNYHLDLPLALRMTVSLYRSTEKRRQIDIDCHVPLELSSLTITEGDIPGLSPLDVKEDSSSEGGWGIGHIAVAPSTSGLRIRSPVLGRILTYSFPVQSREIEVAEAVSYLYAPQGSLDKGVDRWVEDVSHGKDAAFEVALLNALVRFGIPTLFAGQFKTPDGDVGGTATPGFDLVALDYPNRRAVAISAKGAAKLPAREHLENLREGVQGLHNVLPGWVTFGLVACHASMSDIASWNNKPSDINVWGREHLEYIIAASTSHAIAGLLWVPPWASDVERQLYPVTLRM